MPAEGEKRKSVAQVLGDWKTFIGFAVLIMGGYFFLDSNYARMDKLMAEKCSLSYEIRITKADIEFTNVDEEIDLQRNELEDLLQTAAGAEERINFKRRYIESLDERAQSISDRKACLSRAKDGCFQNDMDTGKCYEFQ